MKESFIQLPTTDILSAREIIGISRVFEMDEGGRTYGFEIYLTSGHTAYQRGSKKDMDDLRFRLFLEISESLNFSVVSL